jgi:hypothetical protein
MPVARPDPRKLKLLVEKLRTGRFTYDDLGAMPDLELSRRSLQLYVETHLPAAGFAVTRGRTGGPRPRATFSLPRVDVASGAAVNRAAMALARGVLAELFPVDGTDLDRRPDGSRVLAFASGVPRFKDHHRRALMHWINAAERDPPRAVLLRYRAASDDDDASDDDVRQRLVWPLGVILREGRRVYLPGIAEPAESVADRRMYALERVLPGPDDCGVSTAPASLQTPPAFLRANPPRLQDLVQSPFGLFRPERPEDRVELHVRFDPRQSRYVRGRRWFPKQRESETSDGGIELRFGPVELREAVAWCSQWIDGVTVLGDARLRAAYERSLEARLAGQRGAP